MSTTKKATTKKSKGNDDKLQARKRVDGSYKARGLESLNKKGRSDMGKSAGRPRSRTELMDFHKVYHGSEVLVRNPKVSYSKHGLVGKDGKTLYKDFGSGVYLTPSISQSSEYAGIENVANEGDLNDSRRFIVVKKTTKNPGAGKYINEYRFDIGRAYRDLDILIFRKPTARWFNFVLQNSIKGYVPKYDIVIGPMTDGDDLRGLMTKYRELYRKNIPFDVEKAISEVKPHLRDTQILYHSERSEKYLKFIRAYKEVE